MREIKFRCWDAERKQMVQVHSLDLMGHHIHFHHPGGHSDVAQTIPWNAPLMQFTGLLDREGVEIYEGDIVQVVETSHRTKSGICEIRWGSEWDGGFETGWWIVSVETAQDYISKDKMIHTKDLLTSPWQKNLEVIGNRYQHPSLLSSGDQRGGTSQRGDSDE